MSKNSEALDRIEQRIKNDLRKMGRNRVVQIRDYCNELLKTVWGDWL